MCHEDGGGFGYSVPEKSKGEKGTKEKKKQKRGFVLPRTTYAKDHDVEREPEVIIANNIIALELLCVYI